MSSGVRERRRRRCTSVRATTVVLSFLFSLPLSLLGCPSLLSCLYCTEEGGHLFPPPPRRLPLLIPVLVSAKDQSSSSSSCRFSFVIMRSPQRLKSWNAWHWGACVSAVGTAQEESAFSPSYCKGGVMVLQLFVWKSAACSAVVPCSKWQSLCSG